MRKKKGTELTDNDKEELLGFKKELQELKRIRETGSKEDKVAWVKRQKQDRDHHCHFPGCKKQVPPAMWGCYKHWAALPARLRKKLWSVYRLGQEKDMRPSAEYLEVAEEIQEWIRENYQESNDGR